MKKEIIVCDKCKKEFEEKTSIYATVFINSNGCVNDRCDICIGCWHEIFDHPTEKGGEGVMAELLPCPFCGGEAVIRVNMGNKYICPIHKSSCIIKPDTWLQSDLPIKKQIKAWNTRTPKERGGEK